MLSNPLRITKEEFKTLYPTVDYRVFESDPEDDNDFIMNYLSSKLWRLNNIYTIVDKDGNKVKFVMNKSQHKVHSILTFVHSRVIVLKSRQQGISTYSLINYLDDVLFGEDLNVGMMAQGLEEAATLLERVKRAWENFPSEVTELLGLKLVKSNSKEFSFSNGCTIFIRTSFRSATLHRLHISEFGKIANKYPEKAKETKTGTLQAIKAGNPVVIESTAEGANEFKTMWETSYNFLGERSDKDYYPVFLSWMEDPDCVSSTPQVVTDEMVNYFEKLEYDTGITLTDEQKNFYIIQARELGDDVTQEYPSTPEEAFSVSKDGAYYAKHYREYVVKKKRLIENLYDPLLPVFVSVDLGMNDTMVLVFFQEFNGEFRIIDEYHNNGEDISHYVNIMRDKPYRIQKTYLPHDAEVRELGTGKSRKDMFRAHGVRVKVLPRSDVATGIERVRQMMKSLWIDSKLTYIIDTFNNYSKEWDDKAGQWKNKPKHDEWSNPADAIRYMAMSSARTKDSGSGNGGKKRKRRKYTTEGFAI